MEWIGVIGIVAGLVFFVIAAMRGWNVLITSIVTAIIIALNQQRGDLGTMFESEEDLKVFDEGTIGRDELKMKHGSVIELMRATRNDMA